MKGLYERRDNVSLTEFILQLILYLPIPFNIQTMFLLVGFVGEKFVLFTGLENKVFLH